MKKYIIVITIVIITLLSVLGISIYNSYIKPIPELSITNNENTINTTLIESKITESNKPEISFLEYSDLKNQFKDIPINKVTPNDILKVNFNHEMQGFYVNAWHNNEKYNINVVNNTINIPNEKGEYYYNIIGCWEKGYVSYVFKILVE